MIEPLNDNNLSELLPLIREYQAFYHVADIDDARNRAFFSRFITDTGRGVLHLYRHNGRVVGFSTLYFCFSSTRASEVAVLNDLYVATDQRRQGIARALLTNAELVARERGYTRLQWLTAADNERAQGLYDSLGAGKSGWLFYARDL